MRWPAADALAALLFLLYLSWQAADWLPLDHVLAGDILGIPLGVLSTYAAWRASRRACDSRRLKNAWRWVALALAGEAAGSVAQLVHEASSTETSFPSVSDPLYLSLYPLMLIGLLGFLKWDGGRRRSDELALDCAIVGLGGAAAFAYFVLGAQALEGSTPLEAAVAIAYPVGGLVLLVALAAAVMSNPPPAIRASLAWMSAAMGFFIVANMLFGYLVFHGGYEGGSAVEILYQAGLLCFVFAAGEQGREVSSRSQPAPPRRLRASWPPYVAIGAAITVLIAEELNNPVFPGLVVTVIAALVLLLVVARQFVSLAALRLSRARLAEAQSLSHLGSWDWDVHQDRIVLSDEEARLLGVEIGSALTFVEAEGLVHPEDRGNFQRVVEAAIRNGKPFTFETRICRSDGETRTLLTRVQVDVEDGVVVAMHGTHQDITEQRHMEAQLQYQADHDPLTGLFNRRRFSEELEGILQAAGRYRCGGAVLMIDIDNFKLVNDTSGHATGDSVLKGIAAVLTTRARAIDVVARLGGDEFAVVLPDTSTEAAVAVGDEIRRRVAATEAGPNLSIGVAPFDAEPVLADDVLVAADVALYEAKQGGKDRVCVNVRGSMGATNRVERIRAALDQDRFVLFAQPMVDLVSGEVSHRELLIRMVSEDGDLIPPDAFLPTAERVGLITEIDRWVTREGLKLARRGESISINLSAPSIGDEQILAMVRAALADGVAPSHLIFEITETAAMTNMTVARGFVETLSRLGCGVALDDFGTGFGSFTYLKHLPTTHLKIDMEFVRDVVVNPTDREVVKSITDVAHSLGKRTVAEGVEDKETLEALREFGVDSAQGYFVGRPELISSPFEGALREAGG
ncbi:MAG TPA: EAL domain-containing protein [Solirubrobacterales bacterium]|nr:EAL domain-containing protein [Solirubrobacterales bacterium]